MPERLSLPLQVYLDSSDFSRFGDVLLGKGQPPWPEIFKRLCHFTASGLVEFRYSIVHIAEAAPLAEHAMPQAVSRAEAIMALCGTRSLVPYFDLPALDHAATATEPTLSPRDRIRTSARSDTGGWFPVQDFQQTFREIRGDIERLLLQPESVVAEQAGGPLNREMRRKVRKMAPPKKTLRQIEKAVPEFWPDLLSKLQRSFPVSDRTSQEMQRFVLGRQSADRVAQEVANDLANLPHLFSRLHPSSGGALSGLPSWIREPGEKFVAALTAAASKTREFHDRFHGEADEVYTREALKAWRHSTDSAIERFNSLWASFVWQQVDRASKRHAPDSTHTEHSDSVRSLSSFQVVSVLYAAYIRRLTDPREMPRNPRKARSDFGDMLHGMYIPHVDVFRADGFAHDDYLGRTIGQFGAIGVSKLEALPGAIEAKLKDIVK